MIEEKKCWFYDNPISDDNYNWNIWFYRKNLLLVKYVNTSYDQQDNDATVLKWSKRTYYGYKAHVGVDTSSDIMRKGSLTNTSVYDSQEFDKLVCRDEASVFADKAYADSARKRRLRSQVVYCGILDKAYRNRSLSQRQKKRNKQKSRIRGVVEQVFAHYQ